MAPVMKLRPLAIGLYLFGSTSAGMASNIPLVPIHKILEISKRSSEMPCRGYK